MKHPFDYEIIYSSRRTTAIQVSPDGRVIVRAPKHCPRGFIDSFICQKEDWVLKHLSRYMAVARDIFMKKAAYYARIMDVSYGRISIREQRTRWGSCSSKGNLNFNWRLILAPEEVLDYVVVHELAHRREMNHSKAFYAIVESVLPDYRSARRWLREHGHSLWEAV